MDMPWIHTLTIIVAMGGLVGRLWKISYDANAKFDAEFLETRKLWANLLQKIYDAEQKYNEESRKRDEKYNEMNQKYTEESTKIEKEIREINRKSYFIEKQIRKMMKKL